MTLQYMCLTVAISVVWKGSKVDKGESVWRSDVATDALICTFIRCMSLCSKVVIQRGCDAWRIHHHPSKKFYKSAFTITFIIIRPQPTSRQLYQSSSFTYSTSTTCVRYSLSLPFFHSFPSSPPPSLRCPLFPTSGIPHTR